MLCEGTVEAWSKFWETWETGAVLNTGRSFSLAPRALYCVSGLRDVIACDDSSYLEGPISQTFVWESACGSINYIANISGVFWTDWATNTFTWNKLISSYTFLKVPELDFILILQSPYTAKQTMCYGAIYSSGD